MRNSVLMLVGFAALHWRRILRIAAILSLVATAAAILLPNLYTARVTLIPPQQGGSAGAAMMAQMAAAGAMASLTGGGFGIKNPNDMQAAFLKTEAVEDAVILRFHLQQEYHRSHLSSARRHWEYLTKIDSGVKDGLIHLSVTDTNAARAAELANGWVDEYRHFTAGLAVTEAAQRRLFFERELAAAREDLVRSEDNLKQTQLRTGVIEIDAQSRAMIASAAMLRGQLATKRVELRAMRQFAADQNPDLIRTEQEAAAMESQLAAMDVASERPDGDLIAPKGQMSEASLEYARALRDEKFNETVVELLTRQFEGAKVDEARQGSMVQVVDPAVPPDRPSSLYKWLLGLGGILVSVPMAVWTVWCAETLAALRLHRRESGSWNAALAMTWREAEP